ncbi:hypothetical protein WA026_003536 [Henosepilachna vigintioctopunctata]|uniref:Peptidase M13 N-terminal domain-containing protein n=1 Tax=Henosepilachna vigintioctopunctata TaxID=420089 RepID=A0AAW1TRM8_9CUCU
MVKMPNEGPSIFSNKSWWGKRTKLEKVLLFFFSLAIVCSVCLAVILFRKFTSGFNHVDLCQTNGCVTSAAKVIQNMNIKANPCEDFYEFACGKYTENTHIPDDKVSVNTFDEINEKYLENYRTILEKPITDDEITPFKYTKKLYRMCMNSSKIEEEDFKIFKKMLKDFGGWPVLEGNKWSEMNFDWKETQYRFRKAGFYHTQLIASYIDQPHGGFTKILKKGFNSTIVKAYYDYLVDIAILYGADKVEASKDMMQYMEFKIDLAKILVESEDRRNESAEYNPMTIRELQVRFPSIPWLQYINTKLEPFVTLTYDDVVIVTLPQYIERMEKLISVTPKRTIANYLFTSIAEHQHFNDEMRKKELDFSKIAYGISSYPPKWKRCIYAGGLYLARSSMYVRKYMKNNSKHLLEELITDIKTTFLESLKKNSWMDHKTKKRAIQKAELMGSYVGYPDQLLDDDEIKEYYEGLVIHEDSMLKTSIAMTLWNRNKYLKQYYEPYDKNDWKDKVFPTVVNAFYSWHENNIRE